MITRIPLAVPASGPLYEGHFPGRPILPGIGLLDLSLRALASEGATRALREITSLKLRKLVAPGDALELMVKAFEPDGSVRFDALRAGEIVASAAVILGAPSSPATPVPRIGERAPVGGAPAIETLLPHRRPMLFIERIDGELDDGVVCAARVPGASAFAEEGSAPALVAVEMAAQSAGVFEALRRSRQAEGSGPRIGYLVGARDVKLATDRLRTDVTFTTIIRQSGFAPPLSTYLFAVEDERQVVVSGTLSAWITATDA